MIPRTQSLETSSSLGTSALDRTHPLKATTNARANPQAPTIINFDASNKAYMLIKAAFFETFHQYVYASDEANRRWFIDMVNSDHDQPITGQRSQ